MLATINNTISKRRMSPTEIASRIGCAKTTVSREVKGHCSMDRKGAYGRSFNDCARRNSCAYCSVICCTDKCREYSPYRCGRLARFPFVCNGFEKRKSCTLEKRIYSPNEAQKEYEGDAFVVEGDPPRDGGAAEGDRGHPQERTRQRLVKRLM